MAVLLLWATLQLPLCTIINLQLSSIILHQIKGSLHIRCTYRLHMCTCMRGDWLPPVENLLSTGRGRAKQEEKEEDDGNEEEKVLSKLRESTLLTLANSERWGWILQTENHAWHLRALAYRSTCRKQNYTKNVNWQDTHLERVHKLWGEALTKHSLIWCTNLETLWGSIVYWSTLISHVNPDVQVF